MVDGRAARRRARCTSSRSTTAPRARPRCVRTRGGEGFSTVVDRAEGPLGARDDARARSSRAPASRRVEHHRRDDGVVEYVLHDAAPGEPAIDLEATREAAARARRGGRDDRDPPASARRCSERRVRVRTGAGLRVAHVRAWSTARGRRTSVSAAGDRARERAPPRRGRSRRRHAHDRRRRRARRQGSNRSSTAATAATPTTTRPPADRHDRRHARVGDASRSMESGPVRARHRRRPRPTGGPPHAIGDERSCTPAQRRHRRRRACAPRSSCAPASASSACASSSTTTCATTGCARTSRSPRRSPVPTPSARSRWCTAASPPRAGPHEVGLPTFVSRRFVDCSERTSVGLALLHDGLLEYEVVGDGTRARAHAPARDRLPLARRDPRSARTPPGPLDPLEGPQLQRHLAVEYAVLPHRGDWRAARLADAADEVLVPLERVRGGGVPGRVARRPAGAGRRRRPGVGGAPRAERDALVSGCSTRHRSPRPHASKSKVLPRTDEVVDLVGQAVGPFVESVPLRPWEIVTLRLG